MNVERSTVTAVDPQNPWLGLASFTEETRSYFHGREEEVGELCRRVQRKLLTILFGQSGLGKTSILRAGIVPRLSPEGYCPVYVRLDYSPESPAPSEQIKQAIFRATQTSGKWTQAGVAEQGESLWEFLHHRDDQLRDALGKPLIPLLIFDQFEEIFTLAQGDDFGRQRAAQFLEDLADLVENRPPKVLEAKMDRDEASVERFDFTRADYRILIALREDYLAHLEGLKHMMPSVTQNRMRLARMTGAQAIAAVVRPGGGLVSEEIAEQIVRFIAGGAELAGAEVEPSLLSLVCRELNNARRARGQPVISADLLAGSRDTILTEFYQRTLADQPAGVRAFIEDELLTDSGYRESIAEERVKKAFAAVNAPGALTTLVDRRLLRVEERLDVRRVELTHDVLCGVVKASRDVRLERESKAAVERQLVETQAQEEASRQALRRARRIAAVCAVLAIGALASAVFGYQNMKRAQAAEAQTQAARVLAEQARTESEKLVGFLLEDFYEELKPTGRIEIVGNLADKAVAYYDGLPPELMTAQTRLYRGMALVRKATALADGGKTAEAGRLGKEARKIFEQLREENGPSDELTVAIALSIFSQIDTGFFFLQKDKIEEAAALLRPLVAAGHASRTAKLALADTLSLLAHTQKAEVGLATCEESRKILADLGALDLTDLTAASAYGDVTDTQARIAMRLRRMDDAKRLATIVGDIAERVLDRRPGDLRAMMNRYYSANVLGRVAFERHQLAEAETIYTKAEEAARNYTLFNPADNLAWRTWSGSSADIAGAVFEQGRVTESLAKFHEAAATEKDPRNKAGADFGVLDAWRAVTDIEADRGNQRTARAALAELRRVGTQLRKDRNFDQEMTKFSDVGMQMEEFSILAAEGDYAAIHARAVELTDQLQKTKEISEANRPIRDNNRRGLRTWTIESALRLGNFEEAVTAARDAVEHPLETNLQQTSSERVAARAQMRLGQALLGAGQPAEAQAALGAALAFFRKQQAEGATGVSFRHDFARTLYQLARTQADDPDSRAKRRVLLDEAAAALDGMSLEARQLLSSRELIGWIRDARAQAGS